MGLAAHRDRAGSLVLQHPLTRIMRTPWGRSAQLVPPLPTLNCSPGSESVRTEEDRHVSSGPFRRVSRGWPGCSVLRRTELWGVGKAKALEQDRVPQRWRWSQVWACAPRGKEDVGLPPRGTGLGLSHLHGERLQSESGAEPAADGDSWSLCPAGMCVSGVCDDWPTAARFPTQPVPRSAWLPSPCPESRVDGS